MMGGAVSWMVTTIDLRGRVQTHRHSGPPHRSLGQVFTTIIETPDLVVRVNAERDRTYQWIMIHWKDADP